MMFGYSKTIEVLEKDNDWLRNELAKRDTTISELIDKLTFGKRPERLIEQPTNSTPKTSSIENSESDILTAEGMRDPLTNWEREAIAHTQEQIRKGEIK